MSGLTVDRIRASAGRLLLPNLRERGDLDAAEKHLRAALGLSELTGDRLGQANARHGLGGTAQLCRDLSGAEQHLRAALRLYQQIGDRRGQTQAASQLEDL